MFIFGDGDNGILLLVSGFLSFVCFQEKKVEGKNNYEN
jgi:hypothetical protein